KLALEKGIVFHLRTLDPKRLKGNLEAACRHERQQFFKELCLKYGYQAVMLAHHKEDQAETVLTRVLEGNSLASLQGMKEVTEIQGVTYLRPFISMPKKEITRFVEDYQLTPFEDPTNKDTRFMRANMRANIIPSLTKEYGKEVQEP